ncbi:hypothetical protein BS78_01G129800 [Paspalum vaginatum]|nr:hypothetical protein BS78_01G129800 [Paspalum vaginatum]
MGLLSIIWKIKRKEKEMRILMVSTGRTLASSAPHSDSTSRPLSTTKMCNKTTQPIKLVVQCFMLVNAKWRLLVILRYSLNIWDVGGQKTIRSYWRNYFEQTDGLVWVVDSSDIRRLDDCRPELHNLLKEERLAGASLVFANKQDIQGALKPDEIAEVLNLEVMDRSKHSKIVGCSAYTGEGQGLRLAGPGCSFTDLRPRLIFFFRVVIKRRHSSQCVQKCSQPAKCEWAEVVFTDYRTGISAGPRWADQGS